MTEPRFQPGDFVVSRAQVLARRLAGKPSPLLGAGSPMIFVVVESLAQTCAGGTQYVYACRGATASGVAENLAHLNEVELELAPEPESAP